jgi:hypothetical protein
MRCHWFSGIASSVIVFGASTIDSTAYLSERAPLCANWEQGCVRLWGDGTRHYRQCMRQPRAIGDCQVDNFAGSSPLQQLAAGVYAPIRLEISCFQSLHEATTGTCRLRPLMSAGRPF